MRGMSSSKTVQLLYTYRYLSMLLMCSTIAWCVYLFNNQWWATEDPCNHEYNPCSEEGQAHLNLTQTYGHLSNPGGLEKLISRLPYGKQEYAFHINMTWVCVDQNEQIIIFGAAENRKQIIKEYWVSSQGMQEKRKKKKKKRGKKRAQLALLESNFENRLSF